MADFLVNFIVKSLPFNQYECITHIGCDAGRYWELEEREAIDLINSGQHIFHTFVSGKRAEIGVYKGVNRPYLKTHADGEWNNNLLALPQRTHFGGLSALAQYSKSPATFNLNDSPLAALQKLRLNQTKEFLTFLSTSSPR